MKRIIWIFPLMGLSFLLYMGCNSSGAANEATDKQPLEKKQSLSVLKETPTEVEVFTLETGPFYKELLANGTLEAMRRANLKFQTDGIIETFVVSEGERVKAGQLLATLASDAQEQALHSAQLNFRKAELDYEDQLLRLGYRSTDTSAISKETKNIARLRSGLSEAELELKRAKRELNKTVLLAPFDGMIANVKAKAYNSTSAFEFACTIVDDRELFVKFTVLEQELPFIRTSQSLHISPFSDRKAHYNGTLSSINPQVDESGMVAVKGKIKSGSGKLMDGMGVGVTIKQLISEQFVVPKEAVLERQGRKVVFTATDDSVAYWNYVELGFENSTQYTIENGLKSGDKVIYNGNFNLAHENPIAILRLSDQ